MERTEQPLELKWSARRIARPLAQRFGTNLTLTERRGLLVACDLLVVNVALVAATVLWLDFDLSFAALLANGKWFVTLSVVWLLLGFALDAYDPVRAASVTYGLPNSALTALLAGLVYQWIPWLTPPTGRRVAFFGLIGFLVVGIAAWRLVYARFFFQPSFQRRVLVVGQDKTARWMAEALQAATTAERANPFRGTGYELLGFVDRLPVGDEPSLDPAHSLVRLVRASGVDEILVAEGAGLTPIFHEALLDCREMGIAVTSLSEAYERLTARLPVAYAQQDLNLIVSHQDSATHRLYRAAKRLGDLLLALLALLVLGLLLPWVALINALTSPGPLFYRQQRVGRGGRPFMLVKFRTMAPDAEQVNGAMWAAEDDPRVTRLGRWLRRTRLDELPQALNVLRGEMSVVGPRPERPQFVGEISHALPIYRARHAVRPGITGWAQIRYRYGSSVEDARIKLEYDLYYLKHAGFFQDLLILLQTVPVMLRCQGQ